MLNPKSFPRFCSCLFLCNSCVNCSVTHVSAKCVKVNLPQKYQQFTWDTFICVKPRVHSNKWIRGKTILRNVPVTFKRHNMGYYSRWIIARWRELTSLNLHDQRRENQLYITTNSWRSIRFLFLSEWHYHRKKTLRVTWCCSLKIWKAF